MSYLGPLGWNLNNLTVGKYVWISFGDAASTSNLPNGTSRWAGLVYCFGGYGKIVQLAFEYDGSSMYWRVKNNDEWQVWKKLQTA